MVWGGHLDRACEAEVESETVGADGRALLCDTIAHHQPQCALQQMRCCVVRSCAPPRRCVYGCCDLRASVNTSAAGSAELMQSDFEICTGPSARNPGATVHQT